MANLTAKQRIVIEKLAQGYTRLEASKSAKIAERTIYKWLLEPEIKEELTRLREAALRAGITQLTGELENAIRVLGNAIAGDAVTREQIRAANYLLNHAKAYTELAHYGERLEWAIAEIEKLKAERPND
jgi:hypothetical protein